MAIDIRVLILVPAIAGCAIAGFLFALFLATAYLTVLQSTGAGAKGVVWTRESVPENFWKPFYVGGLVILWLGPALILGRAAGGGLASQALSMLLFGLAFPVSQLSSLSGPSIWIPLWPDVFLRLARRPALTAGFYGLSAVALVVGGLATRWTFSTASLPLLFVGAPLLVVSILVYARLLGRLAFVLSFPPANRGRRKTKPDRLNAVASPTGEPQTLDAPAAEMLPDDVIEVDVIDEEPPSPPLVLLPTPPEPAEDDPVRAATERRRQSYDRSRRWDDEDDDRTPYVAHVPEVKPEERVPKQLLVPRAEDVRLLSKADVPRRPRRAWPPILLAFLCQTDALKAAVWLTMLCVTLGGFVRLVKAFDPTAGAEG